MLTPEDQRALDRVRKLLALATSPNAHEAASAAAHAQALIDRHRLRAILDEETAAHAGDDPITDARDQPLELARKIRPWKVLLAVTLAEHNGCVAYTLEGEEGQSLVLVGRAADREAVTTLWAWLVRKIEWLSATHGAGRSRRWHDDFRVGAVDALAKRLATPVRDAQDDEAPLDSSALARVDMALEARAEALRSFVEGRLRLSEGRAIRVDPRAYKKGVALASTEPWLTKVGKI
ncbi:MAG: DUF2786 domain-containing protein [Polyangiales bacterium]